MKKIVVPAGYAGRNSACPKCHANIAVPGQAVVSGPRPKAQIKKPSKLKPVMVALSAVLVVGIAITATILGMRDDPGLPPDGPDPGPVAGGGLPDEETIAKSVGMVICGFKVLSGGVNKEKTNIYIPIEKVEWDKLNDDTKKLCHLDEGQIWLRRPGGTGSCFVITEDGYAITNMHVVEDVHDSKKNSGELDLYVKRTVVTSASRAIWVALNEVVHPAKLIYVSSQYDCAIIKIEGLNGLPTWKLSETSEIKRGVKVTTLGFPGSSRGAMTDEDQAILRAKAKNAKSIRDLFLNSDFKFVMKSGTVSVVKEHSGEGMVIDHTATINGGNSGGPLVREEDGVVAGINTWSINSGANTFLSIKIDSVRKEIEQFVPNAVWVD